MHKNAEQLAELADNIKVAQFLRDIFPHPYTLQNAHQFIAFTKIKVPLENFGIFENDHFCGVIGAHPHDDIHRHTAELGYWLGEPFWNRSIMTKAVSLMLQYCFDVVGYKRVQAIAFDSNPASMHVLEKNQFQKEGVMRKHIYKNDVYYDAHLYAMLDEDYQAIKKADS
jgi:RimJ/RimL family protein N-acetyltransferase